MRGLAVLLLWLVLGGAAWAADGAFVQDAELSDGTLLPLRVSEAVMRRYRPFQQVAVYARASMADLAELRGGLEPFRVELLWEVDLADPARVAAYWDEAFAGVVPDPGERAMLASRMARLERVFDGGVRRGERTRIDYLPDAGLRIQHGDGAPLALIGIDFTRALLGVWVGPRGVLSGSDAATQQASPDALAE